MIRSTPGDGENCGCGTVVAPPAEVSPSAPLSESTAEDVLREVGAERAAKRRWAAEVHGRHPVDEASGSLPNLADIERELIADRATRRRWAEGVVAAHAAASQSPTAPTLSDIERELTAHRDVKAAWVRETHGEGSTTLREGRLGAGHKQERDLDIAFWPLDADVMLVEGCFPDLARRLVEENGSIGDVAVKAQISSIGGGQTFNPWTMQNNAINAPEHPVEGSPASDRLCLAVSRDGRTWVKTGLVIMDGASVPCVAVEDGTLYVFFNCVTYDATGTPSLHLSVATTGDLYTWTYYHLSGDSTPGMDFQTLPTSTYTDDERIDSDGDGVLGPGVDADGDGIYEQNGIDVESWDVGAPADPSVVPAPGGGWYLFVTLMRAVGSGPGAAVDGADTFMFQAARLDDFLWVIANMDSRVFPTSASESADHAVAAYDPNVLWVGSTLQYFASAGDRGPIGNYDVELSIDASDVVTIGRESSVRELWSGTVDGTVVGPDAFVRLSNGADLGTWFFPELVYYGFVQDASLRFIVSYTYDWWAAWFGTGSWSSMWVIDNAGAPLLVPDRDYEGGFVMDAAVTKFKECFVMVYTAQVPKLVGL